jgi:hypothetical protein
MVPEMCAYGRLIAYLFTWRRQFFYQNNQPMSGDNNAMPVPKPIPRMMMRVPQPRVVR